MSSDHHTRSSGRMPPPTPEALRAALARVQQLDQRHHMHPFTDPRALVQAPPFVMDAAQGCYVMGQGLRLLDAMAGLGCVNIGYGRPELAEVAAETMKRMSFYHSFAGVTNPPAAELAARIAALAPGALNRVFFANSGSEANETAIKLINLYWRRRGQPGRRLLISRDFAYHGSTVATSALNGLTAMHKPFGIRTVGHVAHVAAPFWYRFGGDLTPEEFGKRAADAIEQKIMELGPQNVAAVFAEPIQCTLGAIIPPESYWPRVEAICRKHEILLVADEVVTGFGRTGRWFAQETFGFQADLMTLAKGLSSGYQPISALVMSDDFSDVIGGQSEVLQHGFTTSAHPVAAAVALKNLEILDEEKLVTRIADDIGPYFAARLTTLEQHPLVGEVRVSGLIAGIEITEDKKSRRQYPVDLGVDQLVGQAALARGLIVRPAGNVLVLCPPFVISHAEVDFIVDALAEALDQIHTALMAS